MSRGIRAALTGAALAATALTSTAPIAAADITGPQWNCRASALFASVAGNNRVEPVVANGNQNTANGVSPDLALCGNGQAGASNLATPLALPENLISANSVSAITSVDPPLGLSADQKVGALAKVEQLKVPLTTATTILGVTAANSAATASCVGNIPKLEGTSTLAGVTLGGQDLILDSVVSAITDALAPLGPIIEVKVNEQIKDATSLTVRALHVKVLQAAGSNPVLDLVVAESRVVAPAGVCERKENGTTGKTLKPCPPGSQIDLESERCVIPASDTHGVIVVGRPFEGPSGGTVVALVDARKLYNSICLKGAGPQYAIVGTKGKDRITGTNKQDRILGLAGSDQLSGGRGNDCLDGGTGGDNLSGSLGNDKIYGLSGKDHLNGGPGTDYLSGGSGNDTINAAYGADRVFGGSGNDFINVATAGKRATVSCGSGRDKVRFNHDERRTVRKNCEVRYGLADRKRT